MTCIIRADYQDIRDFIECTVLENSDYLLEKRKNFFKSLIATYNQSLPENIIHAILGTGYYTEKNRVNSDIRSMGISSVKWASMRRFSSQGISFVLGLILARLLLPSDYGMLGMLGVFTAFAGSFIDCGFGSALIRKLDRTEIDCSTVFYYNLGASLLLYMVMFLGAPFIADFISSLY